MLRSCFLPIRLVRMLILSITLKISVVDIELLGQPVGLQISTILLQKHVPCKKNLSMVYTRYNLQKYKMIYEVSVHSRTVYKFKY